MKTQAKKKKSGLGKGLDTLINNTAENIVQTAVENESVNQLSLESLQAGTGQPRKIFSEEGIQSLADSIAEKGIIQPLIVREISVGSYEIIAGERRYRAAKRAGLDTVPVVVLDISDQEASEIALIENIQREDLDPIEEAEGFNRMMQEFAYTQETLSKALGKSRSYLANSVRLLNLPKEVQAILSEKKLSIGHARTLIGSQDALEIAKIVIQKGLSVRQTEKMVTDGKKEVKTEKVPDTISPEHTIFKETLSHRLQADVNISSSKKGKGKISISFESEEELQEIINVLI